jgi:hypothetical protein
VRVENTGARMQTGDVKGFLLGIASSGASRIAGKCVCTKLDCSAMCRLFTEVYQQLFNPILILFFRNPY